MQPSAPASTDVHEPDDPQQKVPAAEEQALPGCEEVALADKHERDPAALEAESNAKLQDAAFASLCKGGAEVVIEKMADKAPAKRLEGTEDAKALCQELTVCQIGR